MPLRGEQAGIIPQKKQYYALDRLLIQAIYGFWGREKINSLKAYFCLAHEGAF